MTIDPAIANLTSAALAVIFAASGAMKLADLDLFESALANYRLVPRMIERPVAMLIPVFEFACAAAVLVPVTRAAGAVGIFALLAMFSGAIAINLARGRVNIDCGCFGPALRQELSAWMLLRNAALAAVAACALMPAAARGMLWLDWVTIAMGAAAIVVLYLSANFAMANAPMTRALEGL
jgi:Methylamine utilisation protein MauE